MSNSKKYSVYKKQLHEITHEISQPLSVAINYIEGSIHYLKRESVSGKIIEALTEAVSEIEQSGKLMREYRDNCLIECDKRK